MYDDKYKEEDIVNGVSEKERTVIEVMIIMNSINADLKFTTEQESDFENGRLPTLSFEIWSDHSGIRHSYYEKPMRTQILTHCKSSQSEQSRFSILVKKLSRRLEVVDERIPIDEKIGIVDHFTTQLVNSGYDQKKCKEIIISGLKGVQRKMERRKRSGKLYRSGLDSLEERIQK